MDEQQDTHPDGAEDDEGGSNPERQGPGGAAQDPSAAEPEPVRPSNEPPPDAIPGDSGNVPNPS